MSQLQRMISKPIHCQADLQSVQPVQAHTAWVKELACMTHMGDTRRQGSQEEQLRKRSTAYAAHLPCSRDLLASGEWSQASAKVSAPPDDLHQNAGEHHTTALGHNG